jgi:hypothetical protein
MRNLILTTLAVVALAACGPSSKELSGAKTARYKGDKIAIFNAAKEVVAAKYTIEKSDETVLGLNTTNRWYTPEGLAASERDMRDVPDKSLGIMFVVKLVPDGENWVVAIEPRVQRYFAGRPNTDKLNVDDPSIPGWATGKIDNLALEINTALKQYEVKSPGGQMAPPPTAPAAAPAAPAPEPAPAPAASGY